LFNSLLDARVSIPRADPSRLYLKKEPRAMKPSPRNIFSALALLSSAVAGCGPDHGRQVVFTAPRSQSARLDPKARATVKAPTPVGKAQAARDLPPSNGVDVPMLQPE
jgi:hypothetical protein